ncbi:hypothetical protein ASE86_13235 [Sphingomonas sp. Leaf33]|uniref:hypothetical protein n=1 Tax=Sphingomonas sp. Leaf33 TaxID=1736215 RepID=UPI0006F85848|nr:hypothetical protein [Sphingomonas sp. Leaf33]KQN19432.1 hypothetical protein ASE86_13235 [Sphingomonas sp. Leaf33]
MADILPFGRRPQSVDEFLAGVDHLPETERFNALHGHVAWAMGQADDITQARGWIDTAILHLKQASSGRTDGGVDVSVASLHLVLGYVEHLEGRLGLIPQPPRAA